ncbi:MAG TPA: DUF4124 domain-containing protein [Candidatus Dormibacteraeota bacterium]|nr:DUF4124 domain-containing protein [Candidatus Dormibacteraeota bacterium]
MLRPTLRSARAIVASASLCAALAGAGSALAQNPNSAKSPVAYRWVDEQGVVHYGDHIPPQYASQERHVLNGQGVEVGRLDAQKTPEQLSKEARERAAQIRQRQHDAFLVNTYTSVKDIEALRDVRLEQMRGQRTAAEQYVESLRSRLTTLQTRAMLFRPYSANPNARRMPDDLAENLVRTVNELDTQSRAVAAKSEEETSLRAQFQADIERYRALHTLHSQ